MIFSCAAQAPMAWCAESVGTDSSPSSTLVIAKVTLPEVASARIAASVCLRRNGLRAKIDAGVQAGAVECSISGLFWEKGTANSPISLFHQPGTNYNQNKWRPITAIKIRPLRGRNPRAAFFVLRDATPGAAVNENNPSPAQPPLPIRDRVKELRRVRASDLADNSKNWRVHPEHQRDALRGLLSEIGFAGAELCYHSERNGGLLTLIDGHLRKSEAGDAEIPCLVTDLNDDEADLLLLAFDPIAAMAEADKGALDGLLSQVHSESTAVQDLLKSLAAGELVSLHDTGGIAGLTDPDDVPEPPDEPITRPGDLWTLGNHRLLCGDSSKPEDVDRLVEGAPIHLVSTDPPYNVRVEPRSNNAIAAGNSSFQKTHHQKFDLERHPEKAQPTTKKMRAKDRPLANDFVPAEEFNRLLHAWFGNLARVLEPGRCFYIWGGYANVGNYPPVLKAVGLYFSQAIIWNKLHPVLTRKDFMGAHEWAFYGWREGAGHKFYGPNNITDLWEVKKINPQSMVHLTEKPVELAVRAMQYSSLIGENVLDLFGGSGSTLIAAEQSGRRAYLMEIDPAYCDVIVQRWRQFTSQEAKVSHQIGAT
jgi:DNA modification methylase